MRDPNSLRAPGVRRDPSAIYTAEWFEKDFAGLQPEFDVVGDALVEVFRPKKAIDVGCGPGMIVRRLRERGVEACGFDGSIHAIGCAADSLAGFIGCVNILDVDVGLHPLYDLVVCTEVAEHLDAEHADRLVEVLAALAGESVVFTSAPPGQGGHDHVNEQPPEYWAEKFKARGLVRDAFSTDGLVERFALLERLSHMRRNVVVFSHGG